METILNILSILFKQNSLFQLNEIGYFVQFKITNNKKE